MNFYKKYVQKYWMQFSAALLFLGFEALCDLMQPTIMSKIVDVGVQKRDLNYVLYAGLIMIIITAFGAVAASTRNIISSNVSQHFGADLRLDLYKKVQSFSMENINNFEAASLMTRLTNDVTQVQAFVHGSMRIFVKAPILCAGSIIMASLLNPKMAWILVIIVPIIAFLIFISMKIGYPFFSKVQKALDKVNGIMREYLSGVRVVKAFNRFDYEMSRFEKTNEDFTHVSIKAMRVLAIFSPSISLTVNIAIVGVLWIGGIRVNNGSIQVGQIIAFINYMTQILSSFMIISNVFNMFVRAKASSERLGEVFNQKNSMIVKEEPLQSSSVRGRIDFKNVYFSYTGASGEPVLKDITFTCRPGEVIGIIGSTGSGKSSLVNLIPRFYDVTTGEIKVDEIDVRDADLKSLRDKVAVVPQKTVLFSGSIQDNLRWGRESASMEEIQEACTIAQASSFIESFPEGYSTVLGQGGVNLSGGQKQRLSIARALIKRPEILIFDDSTSAVDVATEARIREGIKRYSSGLTCLIIAQRITSVMDADRIIVLDNGYIAGIGTHQKLMEECDIYQDIYHSQIGKEKQVI